MKWKKIKDQGFRPIWQTVPMGTVFQLVQGWERIKAIMENANQQDPSAIEAAGKLMEGDPVVKQVLPYLGSIIPTAKKRAAEWFDSPAPIPRHLIECEAESPLYAGVLSILTLWQTYVEVSALAEKPADKIRWINCLPPEAKSLVSRIRKNPGIPIS